MPDRVTRLQQQDRLLRLMLGTIAIGAVAFVFTLGVLVVTSRNQTVDSNREGYLQDVKDTRAAREGCQRGMADRVENIEGDERQAKFFENAAIARRAGGTALDLRTARGYEENSREAKRAAARRAQRLLDANLGVLKLKVTKDRKVVPAPRALDEAKRACAGANPMPRRPVDPPYVKFLGIEI